MALNRYRLKHLAQTGVSGAALTQSLLAHTDRLLGVHIVGPQASELISEAVVAMAFGAASEDLARIVHAHPSLSESMHEAALAVDKPTRHL